MTDGGRRICKNGGCTNPVPESSRKRLNLGRDDGFCGVVCLMEWEDAKRERRSRGPAGRP